MALITSVTSAEGANIIIVPSITLGEEYSDNLFLDPNNAIEDYITHIGPSLYAKYDAPIWDWEIAYTYDYRSFAKKTYTDDRVQILNLQSKVRIVKDLLFLDVRDYAGKTSLSVARDYAQESPIKNQTEYNAFVVNPYAVLQRTPHATLNTGYQYSNVWYQDPSAIDRTVHSVYGDLNQSLNLRTSLTGTVRSDRTETAFTLWTRTSFLFGPRYEYREACFLWGKIGRSKKTYDDGRTEVDPVWDAGIYHRMPTTSLSFETGRAWVEDPYLIERREDRYIAALRIGQERTSGGVSLAVRDYGDHQYNYERKYTTALDYNHFLTEKMQGKYALTVDRYERNLPNFPNTVTIVYLTDIRLDHHASESMTLSLRYRYTDSYSPNIYRDNYKVNRVLVEVRKSF